MRMMVGCGKIRRVLRVLEFYARTCIATPAHMPQTENYQNMDLASWISTGCAISSCAQSRAGKGLYRAEDGAERAANKHKDPLILLEDRMQHALELGARELRHLDHHVALEV